MTKIFHSVHWGVISALIAAFLFSSKAIVIKQVYLIAPEIDATILAALRMLCALPFFLVIAWYFRNQRQITSAKDWSMLLISGLLGYYLASWLDFKGLMYISASLERIILFLYPTLTVLAARVFYQQPLTAHTLTALSLSYGGTLIVMLQEYQNHHAPEQLWFGASLVFASAVAFATYLLMTPPLIKKFGSWHFTGLVMSVACLGTLVHFMIEVPMPITVLSRMSAEIWGYGLILGIFVTVIPTTLLIQSIARLGPAQSSMIASVGPILTLIMAAIFLSEKLNLMQWFGCVLNILGVLMITIWKRK